MVLAEHDAKSLLEKAEIPVVPVRVLGSPEDARGEARRLGYPVVLKLSSALHSHKTEIGGVILDIRDRAGLDRAFLKLSELRARIDPQAEVIIEPMAPPGAELFVGVQRHEKFGLVMSLGLGGVWLELLQDVSFRLLPATRGDFWEMIAELRSWPKLQAGFRHLQPVAPEPILALMDRVGAFAQDQPSLREMDLNPIMAYSDRAVVVDARIVMS